MNTSTLPTSVPRVPAARRLTALLAVGLTLGALTGCSSGAAPVPDPGASSAAAASLELSDGWAKAADSGMTAVFGTLRNTGDRAVTVTGVTTDAVAGTAQLHETVMDQESGSTQMQEKPGGFGIEPGRSLTLEPGGNHIMLMDLKCSLKAGTELGLDLELQDGAGEHLTVPVRDYEGAQERYAPDEEHAAPGHSEQSSGTPQADHAEHGGSPGAAALPECHGR